MTSSFLLGKAKNSTYRYKIEIRDKYRKYEKENEKDHRDRCIVNSFTVFFHRFSRTDQEGTDSQGRGRSGLKGERRSRANRSGKRSCEDRGRRRKETERGGPPYQKSFDRLEEERECHRQAPGRLHGGKYTAGPSAMGHG